MQPYTAAMLVLMQVDTRMTSISHMARRRARYEGVRKKHAAAPLRQRYCGGMLLPMPARPPRSPLQKLAAVATVCQLPCEQCTGGAAEDARMLHGVARNPVWVAIFAIFAAATDLEITQVWTAGGAVGACNAKPHRRRRTCHANADLLLRLG